jgi:hypothetical protein
VARAVELGVFETKRAALQSLFASASRPKRSKIGTFLHIVTALDGHLRFPQALPERTGLTLGRALEDAPDLGPQLVQRLRDAQPEDSAAEIACLMAGLAPSEPVLESAPQALESDRAVLEPEAPPAPKADAEPRAHRETLAPGVEMTYVKGRLVLHGSRVNPALVHRLRGFLSHDKARE